MTYPFAQLLFPNNASSAQSSSPAWSDRSKRWGTRQWMGNSQFLPGLSATAASLLTVGENGALIHYFAGSSQLQLAVARPEG